MVEEVSISWRWNTLEVIVKNPQCKSSRNSQEEKGSSQKGTLRVLATLREKEFCEIGSSNQSTESTINRCRS